MLQPAADASSPCCNLGLAPLPLPPAQANSAILNALLTLLNERLFDNGNERIEVPLTCLVSAAVAMGVATRP